MREKDELVELLWRTNAIRNVK